MEFSAFDPNEAVQAPIHNLDMLLDIPLSITVEPWQNEEKRKRDFRAFLPEVLSSLDKLAGEPVDILVNQRIVAKGEVVVIEENFGVRVTDILSQAERINNLK